MDMEKLKKDIEEWKEFLIEDLQKILKEEIEKDVEVLFDCLWNKKLLKKRYYPPARESR
jgi:hypothetical protein